MITVKEAKTRRELKQLIAFPEKLFGSDPNFVPDFLDSSVDDLVESKNPAFEYCRAKNFLVYKDDELAGTVTCILNDRANQKFGKKYLTLSHLQFVDDDQVVDALFEAAESYARELGCVAVHGPLGFTDMDPEGMLVEGFDRRSLFITYYNHPYYITQMERRGYGKEVDWIEYRIRIPDEPVAKIHRIAELLLKRNKLRVVDLDTKEKPIKVLIKDLFSMYNRAYSVLFGMTPLTDRQVEKYVSEFLPLVQGRTTSFVYNQQDEMVAFGITCPSLETAQQKSHGRMFPFGWARLLHALHTKHNDQLDLLLIAVDPRFQGSGIHAIVMDDLSRKLCGSQFKYAESGPMLETNTKVHAVFKEFDVEQHKRRRCWVRELQ